MAILWHKIESTGKYKYLFLFIFKYLFLRIPGITMQEKNGILFLFMPTRSWGGMFHVFRVGSGNGFTLSFTTKAILEPIIIPKGTILGYIYAIAQLQE